MRLVLLIEKENPVDSVAIWRRLEETLEKEEYKLLTLASAEFYEIVEKKERKEHNAEI